MKIAVIGALGNMGRRYCAIIKYIGHEIEPIDIGCGGSLVDCDRAIIATPIEGHYEWIQSCFDKDIPWLCEKPITMRMDIMEKIHRQWKTLAAPGYMVNNWCYTLNPELHPNSHNIVYNYYNTGADGVWDLIQPLYLSKNFVFARNSPTFSTLVDEQHVTLEDMDRSYPMMIQDWLGPNKFTWDIQDALAATRKLVEAKEELNALGCYPGAARLAEATKQSLDATRRKADNMACLPQSGDGDTKRHSRHPKREQRAKGLPRKRKDTPL